MTLEAGIIHDIQYKCGRCVATHFGAWIPPFGQIVTPLVRQAPARFQSVLRFRDNRSAACTVTNKRDKDTTAAFSAA